MSEHLEIKAAQDWRAKNREHVQKMTDEAKAACAFPHSPKDLDVLASPELWQGEHWLWLEIYEKGGRL